MKSYFLSLFILLLAFPALANGGSIDSIASPKLWLEEQISIGQHLLKNSKEFNSAVKVFKKAYDFSVTQNLTNQFVDLPIGYGIAMYRNGDIQKSYVLLSETLSKIKDSEPKKKAEVSQIIGMTLVFQDKYPEGYRYQVDALKYFSEIRDTNGLMGTYYDIGSNFNSQGNYQLALQNYEKGISLAKEINDVKRIILGTTSIGGTWSSLNDFDKALEFTKESIELAKLLNDDEELAWASINHGHTLLMVEKYKRAKYFLKQAYHLSFIIGNKLLTAYSLEQMSELNIRQNNLAIAINHLDESLEIYKELGHINSIKGVTKKYAEIYYKQENFVKYKEYTDKYIALKDSLYSKEMVASMSNLKQGFEIQKIEKENKIALLTKDQELTTAKNQVAYAIILGGIAIFLLTLALMFYGNKATNEKNELLSAKNAEILRQNKFLADSNRDLEKFAYVISHDLKEPLRNINGFTKLLNRKIKKYSADKEVNEYATFITNSTQQMDELLNGILEYSKVSVNKKEKEVCSLENIVSKVVERLKIQLDEKKCTIELSPLPTVLCRTTQLSQVFQNLIANAVKFSNKDENKITIGAEELETEYRFFVKDEGVGIESEYQKDIFIVFKRLHARGTYTGSGIGLATCKKIIEDHGGRIWVESEKGKGACFFFTLPKVPTAKNNSTNISLLKSSEFILETI